MRQLEDFEKKMETAINQCCMENGSDTPDFILASYLVDCLKAFNAAVSCREKWWGRPLKREMGEDVAQ